MFVISKELFIGYNLNIRTLKSVQPFLRKPAKSKICQIFPILEFIEPWNSFGHNFFKNQPISKIFFPNLFLIFLISLSKNKVEITKSHGEIKRQIALEVDFWTMHKSQKLILKKILIILSKYQTAVKSALKSTFEWYPTQPYCFALISWTQSSNSLKN